MWKCPVCETEYGDVTVCPKCGFDGSCDYERYPTAFTVQNAKSTRALRREWEQKQAPRADGGNINREIAITPEQAAQGCRITAGYFGGKRVEVTIPANWKDGGLLRCAEQGYPGKNGGKNGDLILTVRVQQPEPAQRQETAQNSLNDALGDLAAALHNAQQAKQAQQQAQQPKSPQNQRKYISATATITPQEAAAGVITTTVQRDDKKFPLSLSIPAGVVWGEKLLYSQVRGADGTMYDVTLTVQVRNRFIHWLIRIILTVAAFITIASDGFTERLGSVFIDQSEAIFCFVVSLGIATVIEGFLDLFISLDKRKYGPKTPEEKARCETARVIINK